MKYIINSNMLNDAMNRCITVSDGYEITFMNRPVKDAAGCVYATISACTSSASSTITVIVKKASDNADKKRIRVGSDFLNAAKAICKAGETVTFNIGERVLELSYGEACIPVEYKDTLTNFNNKSPKDDVHAKFTIETKEWKRIIQQSIFTHGNFDETSNHADFNNILLLPCMIDTEYGVRTCGSDGCSASSSHSVIKESNEEFIDMVNNSKGVTLPPSTIKLFTPVLKGECVEVFLFDTQLMIRDGNDIFVMALAADPFPIRILEYLDLQDYTYSFKADISDLKIALDIVSVNSSDHLKAALILEVTDKGVTFYSRENANKAPVKTECTDGSIKLAVSVRRLKDILTSGVTEVNSVVISGSGTASMIHIRGGHCNAFTLPINISKTTKSKAE